MSNYTYHTKLKEIWEQAVKSYQSGQRDASSFFSNEDQDFLKSIGHTAQEVYDFAEDFVSGGDPDYQTFALLADIRRSYFLHRQNGERSTHIVESDTLPAKDASVEGIKWLPRIIPKAHAKLRGEMNPDLMYGCGGDRNFFKTHDIHPAEFLRLAELYENNKEQLIKVFTARKETVKNAD